MLAPIRMGERPLVLLCRGVPGAPNVGMTWSLRRGVPGAPTVGMTCSLRRGVPAHPGGCVRMQLEGARKLLEPPVSHSIHFWSVLWGVFEEVLSMVASSMSRQRRQQRRHS